MFGGYVRKINIYEFIYDWNALIESNVGIAYRWISKVRIESIDCECSVHINPVEADVRLQSEVALGTYGGY